MEEPPISGQMARGTVFSLIARSAVFSAKSERSAAEAEGQNITADALAKTFLWRKKGAHNINLVTGAHYVPQIIEALQIARKQGLSLPVVYNSSGYEQVETRSCSMVTVTSICRITSITAATMQVCTRMRRIIVSFAVPAIDEMVRQTGAPQFDKNGLLKRGTVIRHLMLPDWPATQRRCFRDIASRWGDSVLVSLMRQYTPFDMQDYPELDRTITAEEYADACTLFGELGLGGFSAGRIHQREFLFPPLTAQDWRKINMKTVLSIAGTDPTGGAGIQTDLKTFEAFGVYGMAVITVVCANKKYHWCIRVCSRFPLNWLANRLTVCLTIFSPDAVKVGMLYDAEIIHTVAERLKAYHAKNIVLDPVMMSSSGTALLHHDAAKVLQEELFPTVHSGNASSA